MKFTIFYSILYLYSLGNLVRSDESVRIVKSFIIELYSNKIIEDKYIEYGDLLADLRKKYPDINPRDSISSFLLEKNMSLYRNLWARNLCSWFYQ